MNNYLHLFSSNYVKYVRIPRFWRRNMLFFIFWSVIAAACGPAVT